MFHLKYFTVHQTLSRTYYFYFLLRKLLRVWQVFVLFPEDNNPWLHSSPFGINVIMNSVKQEFRYHDKYLLSILPVEAGWNGHLVVKTLKLILCVRYAQISAVQVQSWVTEREREMLQEHAVKTCFSGCGITHNLIFPHTQPSVTACWSGIEMNLKLNSSLSERRM